MKVLTEDGLKILWSQVNLNDYPNNETLIAVLNAIDETKADKDTVYTKEEINNFDFITHLTDTTVHITAEERELWNGANTYTDMSIANLVGTAPETLNTIEELATAFEENKEVVDVLNEAITTKYSATNPPPYPVTSVQGKTGDVNFTTETWTFTLSNGSTVTKKVLLG